MGGEMIRLKIAVAVAILKHKPPHLTGRQHAEALRAAFLTSCAMSATNAHTNHYYWEQDDAETIAPPREQEDSVVTKVPGETTLDLPSVPSPRQDKEEHRQTASQAFLKQKVITTCTKDREPELFEIENTRFMQSVTCLQTAVLTQSFSKAAESCAALVGTLCEILSRDLLTLAQSCLRQAAEVVVCLVNCRPGLTESPVFMRAVCDFIDCVLRKLIEPPSGDFNWMAVQRRKQAMSGMLVIFMTSSSVPLTTTILETLLDAWDAFCHALRASRSPRAVGRRRPAALDPVMFENGYYVIRCLEQMAKQWLHPNANQGPLQDSTHGPHPNSNQSPHPDSNQGPHPNSNQGPHPNSSHGPHPNSNGSASPLCHHHHHQLHPFFIQETQDRLERSLLHLSEPFPLVAQAVWKVTAAIEKLFLCDSGSGNGNAVAW